jgi:hypothetical protein
MKAETKIALQIAGAGFGIAVAVEFVGSILGTFPLVLCFPCIAGMVLEHASRWDLIVGVLLISVMNAFIYLLIAAILRATFGWFKPKQQEVK